MHGLSAVILHKCILYPVTSFSHVCIIPDHCASFVCPLDRKTMKIGVVLQPFIQWLRVLLGAVQKWVCISIDEDIHVENTGTILVA